MRKTYKKICRACSSEAIDNTCPKCEHGLTLIYVEDDTMDIGDKDFQTWWSNEGMKQSNTLSSKEFAEIAWSNGTYMKNEEFKNRTCDKCKFEIDNGEFENNGCSGSHPISLTAADFGCNRWEKRDD